MTGRENVPEGKVALDSVIFVAELSELGKVEDRKRALREEIKTEGRKIAKNRPVAENFTEQISYVRPYFCLKACQCRLCTVEKVGKSIICRYCHI